MTLTLTLGYWLLPFGVIVFILMLAIGDGEKSAVPLLALLVIYTLAIRLLP